MMMFKLLATVLLLGGASAQLRPRRVGVNSMGEQEAGDAGASFEQGMAAGLEALKAMGTDGGANGMAEMMKAMGGEGGMAGMSEMIKAMGGNSEMAEGLQELLSNPEAMQEKMSEMFAALNSDEGRAATAKIMQEMQSVLTDPDKMRLGLQQFATNPMLKGLADSMPELKEVLDNPEMLEQSIAEFQNALKSSGMGEGGNPMDLLKGLNMDSEGLAEGMKQYQQMLAGMGGANGGDAAALLQQMMGGAGAGGAGSGDGDLKARVQEQLRAMMQEQQAGGAGMEEF